jgi:hypothetical protein
MISDKDLEYLKDFLIVTIIDPESGEMSCGSIKEVIESTKENEMIYILFHFDEGYDFEKYPHKKRCIKSWIKSIGNGKIVSIPVEPLITTFPDDTEDFDKLISKAANLFVSMFNNAFVINSDLFIEKFDKTVLDNEEFRTCSDLILYNKKEGNQKFIDLLNDKKVDIKIVGFDKDCMFLIPKNLELLDKLNISKELLFALVDCEEKYGKKF